MRGVYFERPVDVVVGGDVRPPPGLLEALVGGGLHVDDVGLQLVGPHCRDGLTGEMKPLKKQFSKRKGEGCRSTSYIWLYVHDADLPAV